jgi:hypothetical protein
MADDLTPLERDVIAAILRPDHPVMNALRRQLDHCHVASRQTTGVGFYTDLDIDTDVEPARIKPGRMTLGDVEAKVEGLEHGAGFVLFVRDGFLDLLEGFSYDEPWQDVSSRYELIAGGILHSGGSKTDIDKVDEAWDRSGDIPGR